RNETSLLCRFAGSLLNNQTFFALLRMTRGHPDILFIITDQQRFDTIAALDNAHIYTPNIDRLVRRRITFSNAYAACPLCVAARYTMSNFETVAPTQERDSDLFF